MIKRRRRKKERKRKVVARQKPSLVRQVVQRNLVVQKTKINLKKEILKAPFGAFFMPLNKEITEEKYNKN